MSLELTSNFPQFTFGMRNVSGHSIYEFGEFVLDVDKLMLYKDEAAIGLPPKVVKTLSVLVENGGEILSKDELMDRVWEGSVVEESNLSQYLYLLRKTVGNKPDGTPYIETLRRRGYRFTANAKPRSAGGQNIKSEPLRSRHPLIGRENDIEEVIALLLRDDVSVVTVSGIGGVGKTSLVRSVADQWEGEQEVCFVELAPISRPELVLSTIASALGVKEAAGTPLLDTLKASLRSRSLFVILDNFEQVVSAAPILDSLLKPRIAGLKILITSRIPLRIDGEAVYTLQPLPIPAPEEGRIEDLSQCESVRLFDERAKMVQSRFELTAANLSDVASICRRLEGLPLAIELAAARMNFMSPAAVLKRLEKQLEILKGGTNEAPKRQQTIRETIAWSYELLAEREKQMFARLGVFAGGFDLEAAESVCSDVADRETLEVLAGVTALVENSLLVARNAANGDPRVHMLEVVREFAIEILTKHAELDKARLAHAEHFLRLAEEAEPQLVAARSAKWLDRLETEHDNLREALAWSRENEPSIGQRLAGSIWRFWWLHGHIREACNQLDDFLEIPNDDPAVRAKMLSGATFLHRLAGNSECSRRYAEEGVKLSESTGDLRNAALSYNQLGFLALDGGNLAESERMFDRGLEKAARLGDIQILALLNNGLGELSRMKEDYDRAAEYYARALEYNRQAGDRVRQTTCLINLGATALMREDRESAGSFYRQGLEISSEMEDMNGTLYCLEGLAGSYWVSRDLNRSALLFGAAHAGRQENNLLLEPADKVPYDLSVSLVRGSLGDDSFAANFSDGGQMSLKSAIAIALESPDVLRPKTHTSGAHIVVERQGNVLRLVDWKDPENDSGESTRPETVAAPADRSREVSAPSPKPQAFKWAAVIVLLVAVGAAIIFVYRSRFDGAAAQDRKELSVTQLTDGNFVWGAAISPDGSYFVYSEVDGDRWRMFVQQTGQNMRNEIASSNDHHVPAPTFSPDGRSIYYTSAKKNGEKGSLFRIPTIGGQPTKLLDGVTSTVSFSPDGKDIVFMRNNGPDDTSLIIADKEGRGERILLQRRGPVTIGSNGAWSPDGKSIVFAEIDRTNAPVGTRLKMIDASTGVVSAFSDERWDMLTRIEWVPDGSGIVTIGTRAADRAMPIYHYNVFFVSSGDGISRRITNDGNRHDISSLALTKDGALLVVPSTRTCHIWSMKATGEASSADPITRGSADGRAGLVSLPDGRIAYTARTAESLTLWIANGDGSDAKQITTAFEYNEELRADPAGRFLIFSTATDPNHHLFRIDPDGSNLRQITFGSSNEIDSAVSPDGKAIVTHSEDISANPAKVVLKKIPSGGGEAEVLPVENCFSPVFSPNGTMLSCVRNSSEAVIVNASDGSEIQTLPFPENAVANFGAIWMPDETGLIVITHDKGVTSNLTVIPRDRGKPYNLTNFTSGTIYRFTFSHDGSRLLVARGYPTQDAVLMRNAF